MAAMSMATVLRVKRKACEEPVDGLFLALKKAKCDVPENAKQIYFKFAATLSSQEASSKDHLQSVISEDKPSKSTRWRNPKRRDIESLSEKIKFQQKVESCKKRLDLVNNRRLVFSETLQVDEEVKQDDQSENSEALKLFQLYDVLEENEEMPSEEVEKQVKCDITCNGVKLVHKKKNEYVYDVYIAEEQIDGTFSDGSVSIQRCTLTEDLVYSDASEEEEEYEDEDDSNDESNWRNDYPDEDDDYERNIDYYGDEYDEEQIKMAHVFENFGLDERQDGFEYASYKARIMKELRADYSLEEEEESD